MEMTTLLTKHANEQKLCCRQVWKEQADAQATHGMLLWE